MAGDWRGTVKEIGIRTTKLQSPGGDVKIVNNGSLTGVINMTKNGTSKNWQVV